MDTSFKRLIVFSLLQLGTNFNVSAEPSQIGYDCSTNTQISEAQCQTLVDFYDSTNGESWADASTHTWLSDDTPCDWEGVACWGDRVVRLEAPDNGLSGELPDLSGLSHLMQIALFNNPYLSGVLPDLTQFANLGKVVIFNTSIGGFLPDVAKMPALTDLVVHNSQFVGPVPDISGLTQAVLFGNNLCLSPRVDYSLISTTVSSYDICQPMLTDLLQGVLDVAKYGAIVNDGHNDHQAINNMLTKIQLSLPPQSSVSDLIIFFPGGDYNVEESIELVGFDGLVVEGDMSLPSRILKSAEFGNNANGKITLVREGAIFDFRFGDGLTIQNLQLEGQTPGLDTPHNWWDVGIYVGSSNNTNIRKNSFSDFSEALLITTDSKDTSGVINSQDIEVCENYFFNVVQTTTTSEKGGSSNYSFMNNIGVHIKGSFKFATRLEGASNLIIFNNTVISAGSTSGIPTNNGFEIEGYKNMIISENNLSSGQGVGIVIRSSQMVNALQSAYNWGNVSVVNNYITDYRQAVYISNLPSHRDKSLATASNIDVSMNRIDNMWNGMEQGVIHFVGEQFSQCSATSNTISGTTSAYAVWYGNDQRDNILVEGNVIV